MKNARKSSKLPIAKRLQRASIDVLLALLIMLAVGALLIAQFS